MNNYTLRDWYKKIILQFSYSSYKSKIIYYSVVKDISFFEFSTNYAFQTNNEASKTISEKMTREKYSK